MSIKHVIVKTTINDHATFSGMSYRHNKPNHCAFESFHLHVSHSLYCVAYSYRKYTGDRLLGSLLQFLLSIMRTWLNTSIFVWKRNKQTFHNFFSIHFCHILNNAYRIEYSMPYIYAFVHIARTVFWKLKNEYNFKLSLTQMFRKQKATR